MLRNAVKRLRLLLKTVCNVSECMATRPDFHLPAQLMPTVSYMHPTEKGKEKASDGSLHMFFHVYFTLTHSHQLL
jgi:hypothetical protein